MTWILNKPPTELPNATMVRWLAWLRLFDFQVVHIKGKENLVADGLSRKPWDSDASSSTDFEEFLDGFKDLSDCPHDLDDKVRGSCRTFHHNGNDCGSVCQVNHTPNTRGVKFAADRKIIPVYSVNAESDDDDYFDFGLSLGNLFQEDAPLPEPDTQCSPAPLWGDNSSPDLNIPEETQESNRSPPQPSFNGESPTTTDGLREEIAPLYQNNDDESSSESSAEGVDRPRGREPLVPLSPPDDVPFSVEEYEDWSGEMGMYLTTGAYPEGFTAQQKRAFRVKSNRYAVRGGHLFEVLSDSLWHHDMPKRYIGTKAKQREVIEQAHVGHKGRDATHNQIRRTYVWKGLYYDVEKFVASCRECQFRQRTKYPGVIRPQQTLTVFARVNMDCVHVEESSSGGRPYNSCVVARDDLSGWVEAIPLRKGSGGSATVKRFFLEHIVYRFGLPLKVVTDNGPEFKGEFSALLEELSIQHVFTSAYNPHANGMVERGHVPILNTLSKLCNAMPNGWEKKLPQALHADRITVKATTKRSPFYMVYGYNAVLPIHNFVKPWNVLDWEMVETTEELIEQRMNQIEIVTGERTDAQHRADEARARSVADRNETLNVRPLSHEVKSGDLVLLYASQHDRQYGKKLRFYWTGPYIARKEGAEISWRLLTLDRVLIDGTYPESRIKLYRNIAAGEAPLDKTA